MLHKEELIRGAVVLCSAGNAMVSPHHMYLKQAVPENIQNILKTCHIYLIGRRPSISFVPDSFAIGDTHTRGKVLVGTGENAKTIGFALEGKANCHQLKVDPFPHKIVRALDKDGKLLWGMPANKLLIGSEIENPAIMNLEIVCVGQAFGTGNRSAIERLKSHETLQKILAEMAGEATGDEIELLMFEYEQQRMLMIDGHVKRDYTDADAKHTDNLVYGDLPLRQQIALAEAGLIRYFQPEYNERYKQSFPSESLKILDECYQLGFLGLVVEINTMDFKTPIYSHATKPGLHHIAQYDLHDPSKRRSFFSIMDKEGNSCLLNNSGPIF